MWRCRPPGRALETWVTGVDCFPAVNCDRQVSTNSTSALAGWILAPQGEQSPRLLIWQHPVKLRPAAARAVGAAGCARAVGAQRVPRAAALGPQAWLAAAASSYCGSRGAQLRVLALTSRHWAASWDARHVNGGPAWCHYHATCTALLPLSQRSTAACSVWRGRAGLRVPCAAAAGAAAWGLRAWGRRAPPLESPPARAPRVRIEAPGAAASACSLVRPRVQRGGGLREAPPTQQRAAAADKAKKPPCPPRCPLCSLLPPAAAAPWRRLDVLRCH